MTQPVRMAPLFATACILGGAGAVAGSMVGAAFGKTGLFVGAVAGGVLIAPLTALIAVWRRWVTRIRFWPTAAGAGTGFLVAAAVAVSTLSSPVGPVLSTLAIGAGAVAGAKWLPDSSDSWDSLNPEL